MNNNFKNLNLFQFDFFKWYKKIKMKFKMENSCFKYVFILENYTIT